MAAEIADGMAYLSTIKDSNKIVHCDLAARNCLVAEPRVIKISDFGMAHELYQEYYQRGKAGMLPVRWMAPESLSLGKFSVASDVWSFGVVLWEMVTLGDTPFGGMNNDVVMYYVKSQGILSRPNKCPDSIFNLMRACWALEPDRRPTFLEICREIMNINPDISERFKREAFVMSEEGKAVLEAQGKASSEEVDEDLEDSDTADPKVNGNGNESNGQGAREEEDPESKESDKLLLKNTTINMTVAGNGRTNSNDGARSRTLDNGLAVIANEYFGQDAQISDLPGDLIGLTNRRGDDPVEKADVAFERGSQAPVITWLRNGVRRARKMVNQPASNSRSNPNTTATA